MRLTDLLERLLQSAHTHAAVAPSEPVAEPDLEAMREKLATLENDVHGLDDRVSVAEKQLQARGLIPRP